MMPERVTDAGAFFRSLQDEMCSSLEAVDGKGTFSTDEWSHADEGGGRTRVVSDGGVFEKGAVNVSLIASTLDDDAAQRMSLAPQRIAATGISLILHPMNPFVPTVHANFRYLELENGDWWFGGGSDLTPYYLFEEDARHFHRVWKTVCDAHNPAYYPKFKSWCDRYFHLPHRHEARGVGGIFFDNLTGAFAPIEAFVRECASSFLRAYLPIVERRKAMPFAERHRIWQLQRRSRYAEFNLVYDRGTRFGLDTGGRIESVLVSLPPLARWDYGVTVDTGSEEDRLLSVLRDPRSWV